MKDCVSCGLPVEDRTGEGMGLVECAQCGDPMHPHCVVVALDGEVFRSSDRRRFTTPDVFCSVRCLTGGGHPITVCGTLGWRALARRAS
jgi:hypothetical protein